MNDPQPKTRGVDAEAVKPCPFCGSQDIAMTGREEFTIWCGGCNMNIDCYLSRAAAIAAWNHRPADAPPTVPDVAERCRKMEDALREVSHACHSNACVTGDLFLDPDVLRDIDALICPAPQAAKAKGEGE